MAMYTGYEEVGMKDDEGNTLTQADLNRKFAPKVFVPYTAEQKKAWAASRHVTNVKTGYTPNARPATYKAAQVAAQVAATAAQAASNDSHTFNKAYNAYMAKWQGL